MADGDDDVIGQQAAAAGNSRLVQDGLAQGANPTPLNNLNSKIDSDNAVLSNVSKLGIDAKEDFPQGNTNILSPKVPTQEELEAAARDISRINADIAASNNISPDEAGSSKTLALHMSNDQFLAMEQDLAVLQAAKAAGIQLSPADQDILAKAEAEVAERNAKEGQQIQQAVGDILLGAAVWGGTANAGANIGDSSAGYSDAITGFANQFGIPLDVVLQNSNGGVPNTDALRILYPDKIPAADLSKPLTASNDVTSAAATGGSGDTNTNNSSSNLNAGAGVTLGITPAAYTAMDGGSGLASDAHATLVSPEPTPDTKPTADAAVTIGSGAPTQQVPGAPEIHPEQPAAEAAMPITPKEPLLATDALKRQAVDAVKTAVMNDPNIGFGFINNTDLTNFAEKQVNGRFNSEAQASDVQQFIDGVKNNKSETIDPILKQAESEMSTKGQAAAPQVAPAVSAMSFMGGNPLFDSLLLNNVSKNGGQAFSLAGGALTASTPEGTALPEVVAASFGPPVVAAPAPVRAPAAGVGGPNN